MTRPEIRLRLFFDAGSGVCLWPGNDAARARLGEAIEADALPLSAHTRCWLRHLIAWYDTSLDWEDPGGGGSRWSPQEAGRFRSAVDQGLAMLRRELSPAVYEVVDASGS